MGARVDSREGGWAGNTQTHRAAIFTPLTARQGCGPCFLLDTKATTESQHQLFLKDKKERKEEKDGQKKGEKEGPMALPLIQSRELTTGLQESRGQKNKESDTVRKQST